MGGSCCKCIQTSIDCLCFTFDERDEQKNKPNGTYRQAVRLGSGIGVGDWGRGLGVKDGECHLCAVYGEEDAQEHGPDSGECGGRIPADHILLRRHSD